jgi:3D (Asp-Asp-Asp) domain-containing protein
VNQGGGRLTAVVAIVVALIAAVATITAAFISRAPTPTVAPDPETSTPVATSPSSPAATPASSAATSASVPDEQTPAERVSVAVDPTVIGEGEVFTVTGTGFPAGRQVTLAFDAAYFAFVVADSQGRIFFEGPLESLYCGLPTSEFTATAGGVVLANADVQLCG